MDPIIMHEAIQMQESAREQRFRVFKNNFVSILHWFAVVFVAAGSLFTGSPKIDLEMFDMTQHCDDECFNYPLTPVNLTWMYAVITVTSLVVLTAITVKMSVLGPTHSDFYQIFNYFFGFLLCWDITYLLQCFIGFPAPSFYRTPALLEFYCNGNQSAPTAELIEIDMASRGSFPCFVTCAATYVSSYLFLLTCKLNKRGRFSAKLLALCVPGSVAIIYARLLWQYNVHHVGDLVAGALIGGLVASYILREVFLNQEEDLEAELANAEVNEEIEREMETFFEQVTKPEGYSFNVFTYKDTQQGPIVRVSQMDYLREEQNNSSVTIEALEN